MDAAAEEAAPPAGSVPSVPLQPVPAWVVRAEDKGWKWVRQNWDRAVATPGSWYDDAKADAVVAMFPQLFTLTILRFAGVKFKLAFWQECIVRLFFGWKRRIELLDPVTHQTVFEWVRLFQELRLWIPRKAGKTEFLAALALLVWYFEGQHGGEGYCFARDEAQASQAFARMKAMVGGSVDDMARFVRCYSDKLWCQKLQAAFFLITAKAEGKHGRVPYVTIGDEMHEWKSRDLADNLRQGEGPHLQPVRLYASTAGLKSQLVGRELFEESEKILDGRMDDPTVLVAMFAAADDADWHDEALWARVNPNLGLSPTLDFLRQEHKKALISPTAEAKFRCYHLNQWIEKYGGWIKVEKWDKCTTDNAMWKGLLERKDLRGRDVHISFDSTWTFDFAAINVRFVPREEKEKPIFAWLTWLPADTLTARLQSENVPFDRWRDAGALLEIPGGTFQLSHAIKATRELCQRFNVLKIGWDSWTAKEYYNALVAPQAGDDARALDEDLFEEFRFGTKTLGEASKSFERRFLEGDLEHGGHPVARWQAGHCLVRYDENMNFVPAKKKSSAGGKKSIDLIQTAVMTEALSMLPGEKPSFWMKQN
jgi:phage terminase large subunit-like protein